MTSFPTVTTTETSPAARGREFGGACRDEIHAAYDGYEQIFLAHGVSVPRVRTWAEQAIEEITAWSRGLSEEIAGVAEGAGLESWQIGALNARTEILAAARADDPGECSTAVFVPAAGAPRTIQTWDWRDTLDHTPVVWTYQTAAGRTVHGFTEYGVLGKIGVNSDGLGVHFNILRHVSDTVAIGVPVHVMARRILDDARDMDDAAEIARSARMSASSVVTVVTFDGAQGDVRGLELCPAGTGTVDAGTDGTYLHTNHFLDPALVPGEVQGVERPGTYARLEHLRAQADRLASTELADRVAAMRSHAEDGAPVCCHASPDEPFHERSETLATISLDLERRRLWVHRGGPCRVQHDTWQHV